MMKSTAKRNLIEFFRQEPLKGRSNKKPKNKIKFSEALWASRKPQEVTNG